MSNDLTQTTTLNIECYKLDHDNKEYEKYRSYHSPKYDDDHFSEYVRLRLKEAQKTELFCIYTYAVHATATWFDDCETMRPDPDISANLAQILNPFHKKIDQLNGEFDFGLLNNLDEFFFGLKKGGYWREAYGLPKIGSIDTDPFQNVVVSHGICTMIMTKSTQNMYDLIRQEEQNMKKHVKKFVAILDEFGLCHNEKV